MQIDVLRSSDISTDLQNQVADLNKQLNANISQRSLEEILHSNNNVLVLVCKIEGVIVGTTLLSTYKVISGYRGIVDDVVVDSAQRGKGIGRKLIERLLKEAKRMGLDEILLFTGHHRSPAIAII